MAIHIIKDLLPKAVATLAQPTKARAPSTEVLAKFEAFRGLGDPELEEMKAKSAQFVQDMLDDLPPRWLSLLGTSGAGKTMLARRIANIFRDHLDFTVIKADADQVVRRRGGFISWNKLATALREQDYRMFDDVARDWFVVVDDIGSEHASAFINAKLFEFCARRENKWTVFTGNLSLDQVGERFDTRIASRMIRHGSVVCDVEVPDFNTRSME